MCFCQTCTNICVVFVHTQANGLFTLTGHFVHAHIWNGTHMQLCSFAGSLTPMHPHSNGVCVFNECIHCNAVTPILTPRFLFRQKPLLPNHSLKKGLFTHDDDTIDWRTVVVVAGKLMVLNAKIEKCIQMKETPI